MKNRSIKVSPKKSSRKTVKVTYVPFEPDKRTTPKRKKKITIHYDALPRTPDEEIIIGFRAKDFGDIDRVLSEYYEVKWSPRTDMPLHSAWSAQ